MKKLEVFSRKLGSFIPVIVGAGADGCINGPKIVFSDSSSPNNGGWLANGWNASDSGWTANGWSAGSSGWLANGWNASSDGWTANGWSAGGRWSANGWSAGGSSK